MLIYYQLIRSYLRFITQILFQISRQGHDESQVGMVFPGNQRDGVGKKIVLKRHYIEVREFGEEYIGKISLDCNSCAAIPAAGLIHIECIADTQDLFGKTVVIFTEFRKIMVSQIINGQDKGLLL